MIWQLPFLPFDSVGQERKIDGETLRADPIAALQTALDALCNIKGKGQHLVERIDISTHQASEKAVTLSNHTRDVRRISLETHLMALNAVVKAAHLGENGRTHEVLAQEMRRLSKRSEMFVEDVETIIEQINRSARDLTTDRDQIKVSDSCDSPLDSSSDANAEEVTGTFASLTESAAVILGRTEALKAKICSSSGNLEFLALLSEELSGHLKAVKEICQFLVPGQVLIRRMNTTEQWPWSRDTPWPKREWCMVMPFTKRMAIWSCLQKIRRNRIFRKAQPIPKVRWNLYRIHPPEKKTWAGMWNCFDFFAGRGTGEQRAIQSEHNGGRNSGFFYTLNLQSFSKGKTKWISHGT